ncbi:MAG TPA: hypothetical protein VK469_20090 [Candidatus Kapabacteria bacterium]|nr:hypothetical protein [Candidatus Kapabacteria bacterium]
MIPSNQKTFTKARVSGLFIFFILFCFHLIYSEEILLSKKLLTIISTKKDEVPFFKSAPSMIFHEDFLYIVENAYSKILQFRYDNNNLVFEKSIGQRGQGPGDLFLPMRIKRDGSNIVVSDNNKISFFSEDGKFIRNFNHFSIGVEFLVHDNKVFFLSPKPQTNSFIKVYSLIGEFIGYVGEKFLNPICSAKNCYLQEFIVYKGILLDDENYIYYFNELFGNLQKIDNSGKIILTRDISDVLGKFIIKRKEQNEDLFIKGDFNFNKNGQLRIPHYPLFQSACLRGDSIYFLTPPLCPQEYDKKNFIEIRSINKKNFALENVYKLYLENVKDSIKLFDVKEVKQNGKTIFIVLLDTEADGFSLYELYEGGN